MSSREDPENDVILTQNTEPKFTVMNSNKKKRPRSSPNAVKPKEKLTKLDYLLNPQSSTSNNRFHILSNPEETPLDKPNPQPKPPPLFVAGVGDINPLMKILNDNVSNEFYLKVINTDEIKIQPKTIGAYETIVKELNNRNTEYYSFQKRENRPFKVVFFTTHQI